VTIAVCPVYDCCTQRGRSTCGGCPEYPCEHHFAHPDPYATEEEQKKTLEEKMKNLRQVG
jgi:hypothetical protein